MPAFTRSRNISCSNSAKTATILACARPVGTTRATSAQRAQQSFGKGSIDVGNHVRHRRVSERIHIRYGCGEIHRRLSPKRCLHNEQLVGIRLSGAVRLLARAQRPGKVLPRSGICQILLGTLPAAYPSYQFRIIGGGRQLLI